VTGPPALVVEAHAGARASGFALSCDERVGRLLATLAAAVPPGGRILELGTGAGVGTAWVVHGLAGRDDVEVITVEVDPATAAVARRLAWPAYVRFLVADAVEVLPGLGRFDLVFADALGGKWDRLDLTVDALAGGGFLLVDDMTPTPGWGDEQAAQQSGVRAALVGHADLVSCELDWATGVVLCTRTHPGARG
jgi:predicted O-methyltransferase YrrM